MTFAEHLDELRKRLGYSLILLGALFAVGWTLFSSELEAIFLKPHRDAVAALVAADPLLIIDPRLSVLAPVEHIFFDLKIAFLGALAFGLPVLLWQVWSFIGMLPRALWVDSPQHHTPPSRPSTHEVLLPAPTSTLSTTSLPAFGVNTGVDDFVPWPIWPW